jgi:hypothetical protein
MFGLKEFLDGQLTLSANCPVDLDVRKEQCKRVSDGADVGHGILEVRA